MIRKLEVLGEAAKRLSDATKARRPEARWKEIAGMRDKMIHEYFGVNLEIVWNVVERDLAPLRTTIVALPVAAGVAHAAEPFVASRSV